VRKPGEDRTYRATLNLDISTKFADWIEPGLLDVRRGDLREIVIDRYSIDEARGVIVRGEVSELTRASSTASWELEDVKPEEEVDAGKVNSIINALEDLTIVGVRPKPPALIAALKGEGDGRIDVFTIQGIIDKGYFLQDGRFLSNEGEVHVGTAEGVAYVLQFGEVFTGTDVEIEIGSPADDEAPAHEADGEAEASADDADGAATESSNDTAGKSSDEAAAGDADDAENGSTRQSRYLFIRTMFDESLIEPLREKPVEPEPPADDAEAKPDAEADAADEPSTDDAKPEDDAAGDAPADEPPADEADAADESTKEADYEKAMVEYEQALEAWEQEQKAHEEKLEKGRKRVEELNARFANWYYVISADSFDDIRVPRDALVKAKEPAEDDAAADTPVGNDAEGQSTDEPGTTTTDEAAAPATDAAETSPADDAETKPADDTESKPADDTEAKPEDAAAPAPSGSETPPAETPDAPPATEDAPPSAADESPPPTDSEVPTDDSPE
jgi:hypothetical protein